MTDAGWYDDYDDATRLRYFNGTAWTDHVWPKHAPEGPGDEPDAPAAAVPAPPSSAAGDDSAGSAALEGAPVSSRWATLGAIVFFGLFGGMMLGGCLFNGAGAITPVTVEPGTLEDIDIEFSSSATSTSTRRETFYISGSTASGARWRIASEDAYRVVEREGWPQRVEVAIGDWTGTAERVVGQSFVVDHQTTGAKYGWLAFIVGLSAVGLFATVMVVRRSGEGVLAGVVFLVSYFALGSWLGYVAVQWVQSG